jgi:hypothetical protein
MEEYLMFLRNKALIALGMLISIAPMMQATKTTQWKKVNKTEQKALADIIVNVTKKIELEVDVNNGNVQLFTTRFNEIMTNKQLDKNQKQRLCSNLLISAYNVHNKYKLKLQNNYHHYSNNKLQLIWNGFKKQSAYFLGVCGGAAIGGVGLHEIDNGNVTNGTLVTAVSGGALALIGLYGLAKNIAKESSEYRQASDMIGHTQAIINVIEKTQDNL